MTPGDSRTELLAHIPCRSKILDPEEHITYASLIAVAVMERKVEAVVYQQLSNSHPFTTHFAGTPSS
jgi:hypothetical protein